MPKKPIEDCDVCPAQPDEEPKHSWSEDQKRRQYYYDDAHGYEVYEPDDDQKEQED